MMKYKLKRYQEVLQYDYPVCEIKDCQEESEKLAMTETRLVDFCKKHHEKYILGEL